MQPVAFIAQAGDRFETDLQVSRDGLLVELVGLTRQLDLAVQRLVRNAQQSAIGNAEAVSLRGDRGALHLNRDGAALREPFSAVGVMQLPVAIIGGDHGAGAHTLFEVCALHAGHFLRRLRKRELHLGDGRDRNFRRQHIVEHMVIAQISVREHEIADLLG